MPITEFIWWIKCRASADRYLGFMVVFPGNDEWGARYLLAVFGPCRFESEYRKWMSPEHPLEPYCWLRGTLVSRGAFFFAIEISVNNIDAIQKERIYETVDNLQN